MNLADRKQMLAAAEHIRRCDEADARRASTQSQEPRLTLGRVPAGGKGQYVVYFRPEVERPSERCFWHPEHGWQAIFQPIPAGSVIGSFGPIPYTASEVTAAWTAAGRPT